MRWLSQLAAQVATACILGLRPKILGARGRDRTGTALRRRDFKSRVSTCFTTRAEVMVLMNQKDTEVYRFAIAAAR